MRQQYVLKAGLLRQNGSIHNTILCLWDSNSQCHIMQQWTQVGSNKYGYSHLIKVAPTRSHLFVKCKAVLGWLDCSWSLDNKRIYERKYVTSFAVWCFSMAAQSLPLMPSYLTRYKLGFSFAASHSTTRQACLETQYYWRSIWSKNCIPK